MPSCKARYFILTLCVCDYVCIILLDYAIRLVKSNSSQSDHEGRVEVYHSGRWGTICNLYQWSVVNSRVVCQELGYPDARTGFDYEGYGSGRSDQPVWLENVYCYGTEELLVDCYYYRGWGGRYCNHTHDVGVSCLDRKCPVGYSVIVALIGLPIGYSVIVALTDLPIGYSVIVALTGLPIGYSVVVALTGLPIGYNVIVALTGLPIGYSVIVALTGLPIGYSDIVALTGLPIGYSVIVALIGLPIGYSVIVALTGLPIGYSVIVALTGLPIGYSVIVALTDLPIGCSVIVALSLQAMKHYQYIL